MVRLETERLMLRPWQKEDADDLFRYASDPMVGPSAGWLPHQNREESRRIIETVLSAEETYALVFKQTGEVIGSVGIMLPGRGNLPMEKGEAELGYWIGKPFWGQGLVPEAVQVLLSRCFSGLGCQKVYIVYFSGNHKSKRVSEKCGFLFERTQEREQDAVGCKRVECVTSLSKENWERKNKTAK
ncbi:MAG: GNAT family N-acetyltransferase [Oscillospiraceae bacterium]|nr:GNAT family N-acetyltransferase [Oscillospiraceae bacterium]